jgi:hypothetical protein
MEQYIDALAAQIDRPLTFQEQFILNARRVAEWFGPLTVSSKGAAVDTGLQTLNLDGVSRLGVECLDDAQRARGDFTTILVPDEGIEVQRNTEQASTKVDTPIASEAHPDIGIGDDTLFLLPDDEIELLDADEPGTATLDVQGGAPEQRIKEPALMMSAIAHKWFALGPSADVEPVPTSKSLGTGNLSGASGRARRETGARLETLGSEFWRPIIQIQDESCLALSPTLKVLLGQPVDSFFVDQQAFIYHMLDASSADANSTVYHQDVQMMLHLKQRREEDWLRECLGMIVMWLITSKRVGQWDWRVAAAKPLRTVNDRDLEALYVEWLQPHMTADAPGHDTRTPPQTPQPSAKRRRIETRNMPLTPPSSAPRSHGTASSPRRPVRLTFDEFRDSQRFWARTGKNLAWLASHFGFGAIAHLRPYLKSHYAVHSKLTKSEGRNTKGSKLAEAGIGSLTDLGLRRIAEQSGATEKLGRVLRAMMVRYNGVRLDPDQVWPGDGWAVGCGAGSIFSDRIPLEQNGTKAGEDEEME